MMRLSIIAAAIALSGCDSGTIEACGNACSRILVNTGWSMTWVPSGGRMLRWTPKEGCLCVRDEPAADGGPR